ncbi:fibroblast growth factor receptor substrate 2 isoform X2 [Phyllobates terribilis]|uniref:fibroblast growth factor receptor substrate 2 isoform X2 n=1 Tax=Phyllobates terribilis TaxID=111132 RepID=UPI003CCB3BAA
MSDWTRKRNPLLGPHMVFSAGTGIFAFKCARAEELFNMLQEIMQNNSISVVEEPVVERNPQTDVDVPRTPRTPTTPGFSASNVPNGYPRYPSFGDASSHPSSRHPSVGSTRLPSVGEESTHPLLVPEDHVHTYVNTTGVQEDPRPSAPAPLEQRLSNAEGSAVRADAISIPDGDSHVVIEPEGVKFVLGPTPVQRQLMEKKKLEKLEEQQSEKGVSSSCPNSTEWDTGYDSDERRDTPSSNKMVYENVNGLSIPPSGARRGRVPPPISTDVQNINNSAQRRTALINYENLPSLPPVWEARKPSKEEDDPLGPKTPSLNGFHNNLDPMHNYVNTENVTVPLSAHKVEFSRRRDCTPTVFNFDIRRPSLEHRQLNYIQVDLEGGSDSDNPQTPKTPTTPLPQTPTRRTELYAVIDIERTAAMSNLQKALPRDDGTSRKTRHNSTDLPM